ncbi:MAG: F0F1 ATP synthase subunit epsilon [Acidobacteriota bacterium]
MSLPSKLTLEVITPEKLLIKDEVDEVYLPGKLGYLGILPGHRPLLSLLGIGELHYKKGKISKYLSIFWGFVEVLPDRVIVLAHKGEKAEEIDVTRAEDAKKRAEEIIQRAMRGQVSPADLNKALIKLQKALTRIKVYKRYHGN